MHKQITHLVESYGVFQNVKKIETYTMKMINNSIEIIYETFLKKSLFENKDVINVKIKTNKVVDSKKLSSSMLFPVNKYKLNKNMTSNNNIKGTKLGSFFMEIPPFIK
ncbi:MULTISPECIES: hypothetical protein [Bacillus cereus group]|jgi:hypothetical protein|uniref:hypothetical protein n=2 Tax=Bacillus TaxID=1386 RepID=UPI0005393376|nr:MULTISPECIES: hypothetical protein [Bacillus cereus group]AXO97071.1 hypothetical protein DY470_04805 [Bacillus anthracis]OJD84852.1 hypothetical protein A9486_23400 [Bacillus anthracis]OTX52911.1 hypothetical protein BK723_15075 [Bacillus thuringiensis serovar pondicheriensis]HDX9623489.1 hypothetical protein [Bacillus anthracis]